MPKYTSSCLVYVFTNRAPLSFCLWERPSVYVVLPDGSLIYIHTHTLDLMRKMSNLVYILRIKNCCGWPSLIRTRINSIVELHVVVTCFGS